MIGLDFQLGLARAWGDMVLGCMNACVSASTAMMSQPSEAKPVETTSPVRRYKPRTASWYRPPAAPNPFDVSMFGMPFAQPAAWGMMPFAGPPAFMGGMPSMFGFAAPWQAWTALLHSPFFSQPVAANAFGMMPQQLASAPWWPVAPAAAVSQMTAANTPPPFTAYRSDSGHAVTQITFPNDVVAAIAIPAQSAAHFDPFFAWSTTKH